MVPLAANIKPKSNFYQT